MSTFLNGIITENPTFVLLLGMCPTLATTTSVTNGIGMGLSAAVVLIMSNLLISLVRKIVPDKIRIAAYIVIIAGCVSVIDMLLKAYLPELSKSLGIFIPLIVVNCIIFARAESFASKNSITRSLLDGIGMGLGFTLALVIVASVREILGNGTWLGFHLFSNPAIMFILPPGGFIVLGVVLAIINYVKGRVTTHV
ncbi:MAG: electron transport complex subunit E [Clostridiales bacterium]|nr:electron transport complex subunit E [Clostridiales bacterium]